MPSLCSLEVLRMGNGQLWIVTRSCDCEDGYGRVGRVVGKATSYPHLCELFVRVTDEDSPEFVYTYYGGTLPGRRELQRKQPCYLKSRVSVRVVGRPCECYDRRDLARRSWEVVEQEDYRPEEGVMGRRRTLRQNIGYTEALTLAHLYQRAQPGEIQVEVPTVFRHIIRYEAHGCLNDAYGTDNWTYSPVDLPPPPRRRRKKR